MHRPGCYLHVFSIRNLFLPRNPRWFMEARNNASLMIASHLVSHRLFNVGQRNLPPAIFYICLLSKSSLAWYTLSYMECVFHINRTHGILWLVRVGGEDDLILFFTQEIEFYKISRCYTKRKLFWPFYYKYEVESCQFFPQYENWLLFNKNDSHACLNSATCVFSCIIACAHTSQQWAEIALITFPDNCFVQASIIEKIRKQGFWWQATCSGDLNGVGSSCACFSHFFLIQCFLMMES